MNEEDKLIEKEIDDILTNHAVISNWDIKERKKLRRMLITYVDKEEEMHKRRAFNTPYELRSTHEAIIIGGNPSSVVKVLDFFENENEFLVEDANCILCNVDRHTIVSLYNDKDWSRYRYDQELSHTEFYAMREDK